MRTLYFPCALPAALCLAALCLSACANAPGGSAAQPAAPAAPGTVAGCPSDRLGTARTLTLERAPAAYGKQYAPLALEPGEVVLTFDDGPRPETLDKVLAALARQCTYATFFMTGENLVRFPALARQATAAGHTAGLHSYSHPQLPQMTRAAQLADLDRGIDAYAAAFGRAPDAYRFPFLADTPILLDALKARRMTAMSVDAGIDDWAPNDMRSEQLVQRLVQRLAASGGGILLLHDANGPTADALPALLQALKDNRYRVVRLRWD